VCVSIPTNSQFQPVTVKVTTNYKWLPFLGIPTPTSPITGSATQEIENPPPSSLGFQTTPC